MELITILNRCHRFPGFVYQRARFSPDRKTIEVTVTPRLRSTAVCSGCHKPAPGYDRPPCDGWVGMVYPSVKAAIWMMRGRVDSNVFARREDTVLYVPVNPKTDPSGDFVLRAVPQVHGFARARGVLERAAFCQKVLLNPNRIWNGSTGWKTSVNAAPDVGVIWEV